jgi:nicotinate-nucleotide pyrophosphorylase (carboxylating)
MKIYSWNVNGIRAVIRKGDFQKFFEKYSPDISIFVTDYQQAPHFAAVLDAGAKMVLLDNMPLPTLREAVRINAGRAILEISGGVTLDGLRALAETGVDRISIGTLTKDVKATDFSMRLQELA